MRGNISGPFCKQNSIKLISKNERCKRGYIK